MKNEKLLLCGAGEFSLETYHWAVNSGHIVAGLYEMNPTKKLELASTSRTGALIYRDTSLIDREYVAVPSTGSPVANKALYNEMVNSGIKIKQSPTVLYGLIGGQNEIDEGLLLCPNAHVTSHARVGKFVMMNVGSIVGHGVEVGDFTTIAPYALLTGSVKVGKGCYIGAGALIRQGVVIGDGATVGMGAVVLKDVEPFTTVVGNPAKVMVKNGN